jgi:hypothetical protein
LPIVVFDQRSYWDSFYRDQPFYNDSRYWNNRYWP